MLHQLAALALTLTVATPRPELPYRTLSVRLIHRCASHGSCLSRRVLVSMQKETERIWSPMDVRIAWIDSLEAAAAAHAAGLTVMIEEAAYPAPAPDDDSLLASLTQPPDACGWGLAHLWVRHIERHAARARGGEHASTALPATMADMFLARALGRALAHEIGHYLLGTRDHAAHGLMRAQFTPQDLLTGAIPPLYGLDAGRRSQLLSCRTQQRLEP